LWAINSTRYRWVKMLIHLRVKPWDSISDRIKNDGKSPKVAMLISCPPYEWIADRTGFRNRLFSTCMGLFSINRNVRLPFPEFHHAILMAEGAEVTALVDFGRLCHDSLIMCPLCREKINF